MSSTQIDNLVAQFELLSLEEQREFRRRLGQQTANGNPAAAITEDEFENLLLTKGILSDVPQPISDFTPYEGRTPIKIDGPPLSETVIRDRR
jgi:hypothetical protein